MSETEVPQVSGLKTDKLYEYALAVAIGEIGEYVYCLQNGKFYVYEDGYWQEILETKFLSIIQERLIRSIRVKVQDNWIEQKGKILTRYTPARKRQIIDHFKLIKYKELHEFNTMSIINLNNYIFDSEGMNICAHKKEFFSTIRVPYDYKEFAPCELWIKTLLEMFEDDKEKINILQEFFGYCLTRDTRMEKALLLLGQSRSGKSTILNTLQFMVGDQNCSHIGLENLDNPQYTSMMINKLVNIDGEVSRKADSYEAKFKTIVTGHEVMCNDKFMPPFRFRPYCKFVMSANEFPRITDHSSAFYNRLILIPCNRVFNPQEQNRNLREELLKELPGILNWSLEGLKRLLKRGYFEEVNFMKDALKQLEDENNPANMFFHDHIEVEEGAIIEKGSLYDYYSIWAKKNGMYHLSIALFSTALYKQFSAYTPKDTQHPQTRKRIWRGIRYVENKELEQTKEQIEWRDK